MLHLILIVQNQCSEIVVMLGSTVVYIVRDPTLILLDFD